MVLLTQSCNALATSTNEATCLLSVVSRRDPGKAGAVNGLHIASHLLDISS